MKLLTSLFKTNLTNEDIFDIDASNEMTIDLSHEQRVTLTVNSADKVTISRTPKPIYSLDLDYEDIKYILGLTVAKEIHFDNSIFYDADHASGYNFTLTSNKAININLPRGYCRDICTDHISLIAPKVTVTQNRNISNYDINAEFVELYYNGQFEKFDSTINADEVHIRLDWGCKSNFKFNDGIPKVFDQINANLITIMFKHNDVTRAAYIFTKDENTACILYKRFTGGFKMIPAKKVKNCWGLNAAIGSDFSIGTIKYKRAGNDITRFVKNKCTFFKK